MNISLNELTPNEVSVAAKQFQRRSRKFQLAASPRLGNAWKQFRNGPLAGAGIHLEKTKPDGEATVLIYGPIGQDFWGDGNVAKDVLQEITALKADRLRVRVNSPGGDVFDGIAIYTAIREFQGEKTVQIDGLAASAAAVIAMAGDTVEMSPPAMMMVHDAWGIVMGNAQDALEFADVLDKIDSQIAGVFAAKTGKQSGEIRKLMDAETWYTADEAVEFGLADSILKDESGEAGKDGDKKELASQAISPNAQHAAGKAIHLPSAAAAARLRILELDSFARAG